MTLADRLTVSVAGGLIVGLATAALAIWGWWAVTALGYVDTLALGGLVGSLLGGWYGWKERG